MELFGKYLKNPRTVVMDNCFTPCCDFRLTGWCFGWYCQSACRARLNLQGQRRCLHTSFSVRLSDSNRNLPNSTAPGLKKPPWFPGFVPFMLLFFLFSLTNLFKWVIHASLWGRNQKAEEMTWDSESLGCCLGDPQLRIINSHRRKLQSEIWVPEKWKRWNLAWGCCHHRRLANRDANHRNS